MENQTAKLLKFLVLPLGLLVAVVFAALFQARSDFKMRVHFYANSALVQTASGNKIVVDGGPDDKILSAIGNDLPFYDRTIQLLVLTKVDSSHVAGLVEILKRYKVNAVLIPPSDANLAVYWDFLDLVEKNHVKKLFAQAGERVWLDQSTILDIYALDPYSAQLSFGKTHISLPSTDQQNSELVSDGVNLVKK